MQTFHISEFNVQSPQEPTLPLLLRSKHKIDRSQMASSHSRHPQERIIDANQFSLRRNIPQPSEFSQGIRAEIDTCLNAVEVVYRQQRLPKSNAQRYMNTTDNQLPVGNSTIHRIDSSLIFEFISTIDHDYHIRNRFPDYGLTNKNLYDEESAQKSKFGSAPRPPHKSYLKLTLSANSKKSASAIKKKPEDIETHTNNIALSNSNNHSIYLQAAESSIKKISPIQSRTESLKKVTEQFRYCINCENAILITNIDYHERNECPNLQQIYELSFEELKQFVLRKIEKCKLQIRNNIHLMNKQEDSSIANHFQKLCNSMLDSMDKCLTSSEYLEYAHQIAQFQHTYGNFKSTLNNIFTQSIDLIHKLNSFTQSYSQLLKYRDREVGQLSEQRLSTFTKATPGIKNANPQLTTASYQENQKNKRISLPVVSQFRQNIV